MRRFTTVGLLVFSILLVGEPLMFVQADNSTCQKDGKPDPAKNGKVCGQQNVNGGMVSLVCNQGECKTANTASNTDGKQTGLTNPSDVQKGALDSAKATIPAGEDFSPGGTASGLGPAPTAASLGASGIQDGLTETPTQGFTPNSPSNTNGSSGFSNEPTGYENKPVNNVTTSGTADATTYKAALDSMYDPAPSRSQYPSWADKPYSVIPVAIIDFAESFAAPGVWSGLSNPGYDSYSSFSSGASYAASDVVPAGYSSPSSPSLSNYSGFGAVSSPSGNNIITGQGAVVQPGLHGQFGSNPSGVNGIALSPSVSPTQLDAYHQQVYDTKLAQLTQACGSDAGCLAQAPASAKAYADQMTNNAAAIASYSGSTCVGIVSCTTQGVQSAWNQTTSFAQGVWDSWTDNADQGAIVGPVQVADNGLVMSDAGIPGVVDDSVPRAEVGSSRSVLASEYGNDGMSSEIAWRNISTDDDGNVKRGLIRQDFNPETGDYTFAQKTGDFGQVYQFCTKDCSNEDNWIAATRADRGPYVGDRVVDLSPRVSAESGFDGLSNVQMRPTGITAPDFAQAREITAALNDGAAVSDFSPSGEYLGPQTTGGMGAPFRDSTVADYSGSVVTTGPLDERSTYTPSYEHIIAVPSAPVGFEVVYPSSGPVDSVAATDFGGTQLADTGPQDVVRPGGFTATSLTALTDLPGPVVSPLGIGSETVAASTPEHISNAQVAPEQLLTATPATSLALFEAKDGGAFPASDVGVSPALVTGFQQTGSLQPSVSPSADAASNVQNPVMGSPANADYRPTGTPDPATIPVVDEAAASKELADFQAKQNAVPAPQATVDDKPATFMDKLSQYADGVKDKLAGAFGIDVVRTPDAPASGETDSAGSVPGVGSMAGVEVAPPTVGGAEAGGSRSLTEQGPLGYFARSESGTDAPAGGEAKTQADAKGEATGPATANPMPPVPGMDSAGKKYVDDLNAAMPDGTKAAQMPQDVPSADAKTIAGFDAPGIGNAKTADATPKATGAGATPPDGGTGLGGTGRTNTSAHNGSSNAGGILGLLNSALGLAKSAMGGGQGSGSGGGSASAPTTPIQANPTNPLATPVPSTQFAQQKPLTAAPKIAVIANPNPVEPKTASTISWQATWEDIQAASTTRECAVADATGKLIVESAGVTSSVQTPPLEHSAYFLIGCKQSDGSLGSEKILVSVRGDTQQATAPSVRATAPVGGTSDAAADLASALAGPSSLAPAVSNNNNQQQPINVACDPNSSQYFTCLTGRMQFVDKLY